MAISAEIRMISAHFQAKQESPCAALHVAGAYGTARTRSYEDDWRLGGAHCTQRASSLGVTVKLGHNHSTNLSGSNTTAAAGAAAAQPRHEKHLPCARSMVIYPAGCWPSPPQPASRSTSWHNSHTKLCVLLQPAATHPCTPTSCHTLHVPQLHCTTPCQPTMHGFAHTAAAGLINTAFAMTI
jgi:hypothetical protein